MGIGASIKKGFSTAAGSMGLVLVLFLFGAFWNLLNIFINARVTEPTPQTSIAVIAAGVVFILLSVFMQAGSLGFVKEKLKTGASSLGTFAASGGKYYGRLFVIGLLIALLIGAFVLVAALAVAAIGDRIPALAIGIAVVIAAISLYFVILLFLAPYIAVVDEKGPIASLKESVGVVRRNILAVLGIAGLLVVIGFVSGLLLGLIFALISTAAGEGVPSQSIFAVLSSFVNAFLGVLVSASFMAFYLGRRTDATA
jgi:hypothetical protein